MKTKRCRKIEVTFFNNEQDRKFKKFGAPHLLFSPQLNLVIKHFYLIPFIDSKSKGSMYFAKC